jgi:hypothetical protein
LRHLAATMTSDYGWLVETHAVWNPWWKERPQQMSQFQAWLLSPLTGKALEDGFFAYAREPFAKELSDAAQQFAWVQEAMSASSKES